MESFTVRATHMKKKEEAGFFISFLSTNTKIRKEKEKERKESDSEKPILAPKLRIRGKYG